MEVNTINVATRTAVGSSRVAALRAEGRVPAVLYGGGRDNLSVSIDEHELARELRHHNRVFKLAMDGKEQAIFLQDVQWDCLTDRPLHVDFRRIELDQPMSVEIELTFFGRPQGETRGGTFVKDRNRITLACLPAAMPESVEVKIGHLDLSEKLFASELVLPEGVTLAVPETTVVCHMTGETREEPEPEAEAAPDGESGGGEG